MAVRKTGVGSALQEKSDEQFRLMVESVQDYAIFMLDPGGHIATWNAGARRIKGYAADEIIGRHFSIFYPPADIASRKPWRELEIAAVEGRLEDEGWRIRQDGSRFWTNVVITALRDESGELRGFTKVTRDLTERVRAEEERAKLKAEQAARTAAESANRRLSFLAEASQALSESLDYAATLTMVAQLAVPRIADWCTVFLMNEDESVQQVAVSHIDPAKRERLQRLQQLHLQNPNASQGLWQVLRAGNAEFHPATEASAEAAGAGGGELRRLLGEVGIGSSMIVPLVARGRVLGALQLVCAASGRRYEAIDLTMAEALAGRVALAIDNSRLYHESRLAVARLDESYALLEAFLNSASSGFVFLDNDLRVLRVNNALAALNGRPPEEHIGRMVGDVLPLLADALAPACQRLQATGESLDNLELSAETAAFPGELRHWLVNINPVRTRGGQTIGIGAVVTDITERKRMEEAIRENEALLSGQKRILELIAQAAPLSDVLHRVIAFIEEWSPDTSCAIHLVDASGRFLRCAAAPSLPEVFRDRIQSVPVGPGGGAPEIPPDLDCGIHTCFTAPLVGSRRELVGTLSLYERTDRGPGALPHKLVAISTHLLTFAIERSKAEEARNLKLQTLVEHMAEGMIAIDDTGRILLANPTAHQLLDLRGPVEGVPLDELQLPALLCEALKDASEPGFPGPVRLLLSLGQTELEAYVSPVATDIGRYGALTLLKDVTMEVQLKRLQSSFVANVSHELRGPLASVSAVVEAFRDGLIGESVRARYLTAVVAEIGRLRRLTDQLLELSKLDAGVVTLRAAEFELGELCRVLGELWNYQCVNAGLHLTVDCPRISITADHDAVEQVLVNLLENAVRFTPVGGTIALSARVDGDRVAIDVADSGAGIPPEHIPYIWEPFYKADEARTLRPNSGTGLGLSIAKRLVAQMGGEIRVESEVNRRTVFQVFLPLA